MSVEGAIAVYAVSPVHLDFHKVFLSSQNNTVPQTVINPHSGEGQVVSRVACAMEVVRH